MWSRWRKWVKENIQCSSDSLAVTIVIIAVLVVMVVMQGLYAEHKVSQLRTVKEAYANLLQACP